MKYCEQCGERLDETSNYCEECGAEAENTSINTNTNPEKNAIRKNEGKTLTKKQRLVGISAIGLVASLFFGYQLGATVYSQENQTQRIVEALSSKDPEQIANITTTNDVHFDISSENLVSFTTYLEQNPSYLKEMIEGLNQYGEFGSFYIEQNGKSFGLYDTYNLVMVPIYGMAHTNTEGVTVSIGEQELFVSENDQPVQIGPFAPGVLSFTAEGELSGFPLIVTEEATWLNADAYNEVNLNLTGEFITVHSDLENAVVYVDDEKIGQLENGSAELGPIQITEGMSLYIAQAFGDEEVKSETVQLSKEDTYFEFYDLVIGSEEDVRTLIEKKYYTAYQLSTSYDQVINDFSGFYHADGSANKEDRSNILALTQSAYNDEEIDNIQFNVSFTDIKRSAPDAFEVEYEVTYLTNYSYNSDKSDAMKHYSIEATVLFEPTNHPNREFDSFIYDITADQLIYEEGHDESEEPTNKEMDSNDDDASAVVIQYIEGLPKAVNNNDFSEISSYIDPSSDFYESQSTFVTNTHNKGITEELDYYDIHDVSIDGDSVTIRVTESFIINKDGKDSLTNYIAVYELNLINGNYLITNFAIE